ncbi:MAG TPA: 50S ribosomal protein L17 [Candidatus Paceibacterota bacterium]|nr:50S ribosomal protein L17 [Candidatus Paceibacterota bacterium]HRZ34545.1 50S ribosomal protein L17 [Candidatus Paceibacterota bacterium]
MRHHNRNKKFGRERDARRALLRLLACSLIRDGKIKTTEIKAKVIRPFVEKLVTKAKKDSPANRRVVLSVLGNSARTNKLFKEIGPKYVARTGGYTRVIKLPIRKSDAAKMALIEFV